MKSRVFLQYSEHARHILGISHLRLLTTYLLLYFYTPVVRKYNKIIPKKKRAALVQGFMIHCMTVNNIFSCIKRLQTVRYATYPSFKENFEDKTTHRDAHACISLGVVGTPLSK